MSLTDAVLEGNRLALARLLTQVENVLPEGRTALAELFPHTGRAHLIGVTGAPGTGKSSLVNQMALYYRRNENRRIAIIAVDPSSPFTGGAVLGDRVRMRDLSGDPGIFIRSMASRGSVGGIAQATAALAQVFDAAGFDIIIIETVGAGQSEVDIARLAHTTLVVEAPGMGDDIQAIKAGILEIADILVINKADRPGVENTERALRTTLELAHPTKQIGSHHGRIMDMPSSPVMQNDKPIWIPPILKPSRPKAKGLKNWQKRLHDMSNICTTAETGPPATATGWRRNWTARVAGKLDPALQGKCAEKSIRRNDPEGPRPQHLTVRSRPCTAR